MNLGIWAKVRDSEVGHRGLTKITATGEASGGERRCCSDRTKFCEAALRMVGMLRVGVLGAGWAGEGHVAAYSRLPGVEVTGLWSPTKTRAQALAGKLGYANLTVYDKWQSLIGAGTAT